MRGRLPFTFEDRTAGLCDTDFDDIYDRRFFHVRRGTEASSSDASTTTAPTNSTTTTTEIFEMHFPASRHRGNVPPDTEPIIRLEFVQPGQQLGTISFLGDKSTNATVQMTDYLRKVSFFGPSSSRKFIGSDGREYRWEYQSNPGQEWTCTTKDDYVVAHYDLYPSDVRYLGGSGSSLVIDEAFENIAPEILATCLIMRHIALYNL